MLKKVVLLNKKIGQTPLELLEDFKKNNPEYADEKMAYAGRLDPMATGLMLFLVGDECKKRDEYQGFDKTYEFDVLFGIESDTYDVLGIQTPPNPCLSAGRPFFEKEGKMPAASVGVEPSLPAGRYIQHLQVKDLIPKFTGKIKQKYPPFSSFHVAAKHPPAPSLEKRGSTSQNHDTEIALKKPLWWWAKNGRLDEIEIPEKEVKVRSLEYLGEKKIKLEDFVHQVVQDIEKVKGDFRQDEIIEGWERFLQTPSGSFFGKNGEIAIHSFKAKVSTGTYIRSIVHEMGKELGVGAIAARIHRTSVGEYELSPLL